MNPEQNEIHTYIFMTPLYSGIYIYIYALLLLKSKKEEIITQEKKKKQPLFFLLLSSPTYFEDSLCRLRPSPREAQKCCATAAARPR